MSGNNAPSATLDLKAYRKSQANIRRLKDRLPEDLVANLAREVIRQLGARDENFEIATQGPSSEELEQLGVALISDDETAGAKIIFEALSEGVSAEAIYLKYLAAAARLLGDWWLEDRVGFVEVTVGTGRMFSIMRSMRHRFDPVFGLQTKAAIFASVPGEDHTLGVRMAADLFRKDGWAIALKVGLDHDELLSEIENAPDHIVGLSIGGRHSIDALSRLVVALHLRCPKVRILVSGQDIEDIRPLLSLMGLDGISSSVSEAKQQLTELWDKELAGA